MQNRQNKNIRCAKKKRELIHGDLILSWNFLKDAINGRLKKSSLRTTLIVLACSRLPEFWIKPHE